MAQAQAAKRPPAVAPAPPKKPPVVNTARPSLPTAAPRSDERRFIPPPKGKSTFKYTLPEPRPIVPAPAMGRAMSVPPFMPNMVRPDLPAAPVNYRRDPQMDLPPTDERRFINPKLAPAIYKRDPQMDLPPTDERRLMDMRERRLMDMRPNLPDIDWASRTNEESKKQRWPGGSELGYREGFGTKFNLMNENEPNDFMFSVRGNEDPKKYGITERYNIATGKGGRGYLSVLDTRPGVAPDPSVPLAVPGRLRYPNAGTSTFTPPKDEGISGATFDLPERMYGPKDGERENNDRNSMIDLVQREMQIKQGGVPLTAAQKRAAIAEVDVYIANRGTTLGQYKHQDFDFTDLLGEIAANAAAGSGMGAYFGGTGGAILGIPGGPPAMAATGGLGAMYGAGIGAVGGGLYGGGEYISDYLQSNYGTPYEAALTGESASGDLATYFQNLSNQYGLNNGNPYPVGSQEYAAYDAARRKTGRATAPSPDALAVIALDKQKQAEARAKQEAYAASGMMADVLPPKVRSFVGSQDPAFAGSNALLERAAQGYMEDYKFNLLMLGVKNGEVPIASLYDVNLKLSPEQQREVLAYLANPTVTKPAGNPPPSSGLGGGLGDGLGGGNAVIPAGPPPPPGGETTAAGDGMTDFEKLAQLMEIGKYARAPVEPDRTRENELYALLQGSQGKQEALMQQYIEALIKQLNAQPQSSIPAVPAPATGGSSGNPFPLSGVSQVARLGSNLQFSNAGLGYLNSIDPALLQALMQYLKAQQYTGMGQMGTYGELNYSRAGGVGPLTMSDASFENPLNYAGLSTQMREPAEAGLRSLFAQMGLMG